MSESERREDDFYPGPCIHAGFSSVVLSTIERRYRFSSTAAGLISSMYDMAILVSVVFISYFGGKGHKPRWLGVSLIIQGIGIFMIMYLRL